MKSIQIISEDIYGCDFFKEVAHRINREVRVFCNSAQAWSPKRGRIFAASNADLVIVCIDADARDPEEVEREQLKIIKRSARSEQDVEKRLKIVVFSYEAEEWIIASVNYPALTDGALGFPVTFTTHLHFPFRVFTYPRPVPLVKARAMFTDSSHGCIPYHT